MADAGELKARATLDNAEFLGALKEMVTKVGESSEAAAGQLESIAGGFEKIAHAALGIAELGAFGKFAENCLDAAVAVNKLEAAFKALNGPTEETKQIFDEIKDLQFKSMYDFEETLGPAAKNMMQLGMSGAQTAETLKAVVDAAAAMKQSPEWIGGVSEAFARMSAHIVASQRDLKALQQSGLGVDVYAALAKEIGTSVPEAIEKVKHSQVDAQTVTEAVTKAMEERWHGAAQNSLTSWKGAMHLFDESTKEAREAIGQSILGILNDFAPVLKSVADGIKDLTEWWKNLSDPIKESVLVVGGATAAVTGLATTLGAFGITLGAPIAAVGALVAALALIGKWAYDEWPAIKAVLVELGSWFEKTFSGVAEIVGNAWEAIKSTFGTLGQWIGDMLSGLGSAVAKFFSWIGDLLSKAPGGIGEEWKKLGQVWQNAQAEMAKTAQAAKDLKAAQDASAAAATTEANEARRREAQELAATNAAKERAAAAKKAADEAKRAAAEAEREAKAQEKLVEDLWKVTEDLSKSWVQLAITFGKAHEDMVKTSQKTVEITVPLWKQLPQGVNDYLNELAHVNAAMKTLGMESQAQLQSQVDSAKRAYETIASSALSSESDVERAWDAYVQTARKARDETDLTQKAFHDLHIQSSQHLKDLADDAEKDYERIAASADTNATDAKKAWIEKTQAAYDAILAKGGTLTDQQKSELDRAKQQLDDHLTQTKSSWQTAYDGIKGTVTGAFDDMIDKLAHGDLSFGATFKKLCTDLASTVLHTFIDPFKDAITNLISNELADLLGPKGLGGVTDSLKGIGGAIANVFSGGAGGAASGAMPAVGDFLGATGGTGGGAAGGAAGAAGGLGGVMGTIGAVGSVGSFVTGIIGNFQNAKQEKTLNAIEESTRYTMLFTGGRADGGILMQMFKVNENLAWGPIVKAAESHRDLFKDWSGEALGTSKWIRDVVSGMSPYIPDIKTAIQDLAPRLDKIVDATMQVADMLQRSTANGSPQSITVNVSPQGLTTAEAAKALGDQIARNLTGQLTGVGG